MDPGLARDGLAAFRELPRSADPSVLLCTDLHAGNVLSGQRRPWLLIDPKPYVGDPHYDVAPAPAELRATACVDDPHGLVRRISDLTGLDAERVRDWLSRAVSRRASTLRNCRRWRAGSPADPSSGVDSSCRHGQGVATISPSCRNCSNEPHGSAAVGAHDDLAGVLRQVDATELVGVVGARAVDDHRREHGHRAGRNQHRHALVRAEVADLVGAARSRMCLM